MTRLSAHPIGFASRISALCSVLLMLTGAAARAQSADPAAAPPAPTQPSVQDQGSGDCEPIGLTASGEIVFPFRCKDMVERQRAAVTKLSEPKPAVADAAPVVQEKLRPTSSPTSGATCRGGCENDRRPSRTRRRWPSIPPARRHMPPGPQFNLRTRPISKRALRSPPTPSRSMPSRPMPSLLMPSLLMPSRPMPRLLMPSC